MGGWGYSGLLIKKKVKCMRTAKEFMDSFFLRYAVSYPTRDDLLFLIINLSTTLPSTIILYPLLSRSSHHTLTRLFPSLWPFWLR
jgi:hypothetical protein